ncbi:hypothetical protein HU200_013279 [Digitaria exilis]|uniref:Uncharacterized protein n=2 Tax=Poaceae TaxID=4479 RepID=A0A835FEH1_9POAL|nr:hypothetical protein HU200_013279 [Digitaria exilis]
MFGVLSGSRAPSLSEHSAIPSMLHSFYAKHPITGSESHSRSYLSRKKRTGSRC